MKEKYWKISHNADTTETGRPMKRTYVKTIWQGFPAQQSCEAQIMDDFCFDRFGKKTAYVQGVAPCPGWTVVSSNEEEFMDAEPIVWGGYKTKTMRLELGIGDHGKISILSEELRCNTIKGE